MMSRFSDFKIRQPSGAQKYFESMQLKKVTHPLTNFFLKKNIRLNCCL
jgi:hypothetical protein